MTTSISYHNATMYNSTSNGLKIHKNVYQNITLYKESVLFLHKDNIAILSEVNK